jgi:TetR/AcrR family transcriptional regulator
MEIPSAVVAHSNGDAASSAARDAILAAARGEFSAKGLKGARVNEIAARAGVNKQLLY